MASPRKHFLSCTVVHVESDGLSCVKDEKRELNRQVKSLSTFTPLWSLHECQFVGFTDLQKLCSFPNFITGKVWRDGVWHIPMPLIECGDQCNIKVTNREGALLETQNQGCTDGNLSDTISAKTCCVCSREKVKIKSSDDIHRSLSLSDVLNSLNQQFVYNDICSYNIWSLALS